MIQPTLFGTDARLPQSALRPQMPPLQLNAFSAAAERLAWASGRPVSQERTELVAGPGMRCLRDHAMRLARGQYVCPECDNK